ncbi:MAG: hypothetical protein ACYTGZ_21365 [Planctomycetota bacterium]|jgi:hypothetical protein
MFPRARDRVLVLCCLAVAACQTENGDDGTSRKRAGHTLSAGAPMSAERIGSGVVDPEQQKFVEFVLTDVHNPGKTALIFEVHYRDSGGEREFLGTFGPFPPDNVGTFIVATQGKLRAGGTVELSLQAGDKGKDLGEVRVDVDRFSYREQ